MLLFDHGQHCDRIDVYPQPGEEAFGADAEGKPCRPQVHLPAFCQVNLLSVYCHHLIINNNIMVTRVSEQSKVNCMDSKNLAICWWPTLLQVSLVGVINSILIMAT